MKFLNEVNVRNKKVLVRCDFNVAFGDDGKISDDFRIVKALPTIKYLAKNGAIVILMSHLENKKQVISLEPVAHRLAKLLGTTIKFSKDCVGDKVRSELKTLRPGQIVLLENLRFHPQEKANDYVFARRIAEMADIYVNEAFSCSHRTHASIDSVPKFLPCYAGLLLEAEITNLSKLLKDPNHPFVVVIGGAKVSSKAGVINNISKIADHVLIGSKIGEKILAQKHQLLGRQVDEKDPAIETLDLTSSRINLPIDGILALNDLSEGYSRTAAIGQMRREEEIYDIGPETINFYTEIIKDAQMIFFNGPVGMAEKPEFSGGTRAVLEAISRTHNAYRVAGGGETLEVIHKYKLEKSFNFLSTGGGAMLEYLAGNKLPGIVVLDEMK